MAGYSHRHGMQFGDRATDSLSAVLSWSAFSNAAIHATAAKAQFVRSAAVSVTRGEWLVSADSCNLSAVVGL